MPNWCDNFVRIEHKNKDAIERVVKAFRIGKFCSEFAPIPRELEEVSAPNRDANAEDLVQKYGYSDWYEFCVNEWGTKWDIGEDMGGSSIDTSSDESVSLTFQSAWAPPVELYRKMTNEGYDITAYYYEPGCAFVGKYTSEDGDECYTIPERSKDVKEKIPEELDDMFNITESMAEFEDA